MKKLPVLCALYLVNCAMPFSKLSEELSVKQVVYRAGKFYRVETILKNTSNNALDLKIVCSINGEEEIDNVKVAPHRKFTIEKKIFAPPSGISILCEYYKRERNRFKEEEAQ